MARPSPRKLDDDAIERLNELHGELTDLLDELDPEDDDEPLDDDD